MAEEQTDRTYESRGLMLHGVVGQREVFAVFSIFFFLQGFVKLSTFSINFL